MPALVTSNFRISNAKQFINSFQPSNWGGFQRPGDVSYVYMFIGKPVKWEETHIGYNDITVPAPDGDVQGNSYEPWRDMIGLDRVANTNIMHGVKRTNWLAGVVYAQYDDQDPGVAKGTVDFFVHTDVGSVFKCLDNGGGSQSTSKPTAPSSQVQEPFVTGDGYRWKYMYTIPQAASLAFLSTNYIPTRTLNSFSEVTGDGIPDGWGHLATIQRYANAGTLEAYVVVSGGSAFTAHSGGVAEVDRVIFGNNVHDAASGTHFVELTPHADINTLDINHYRGAFFVAYDTTGVLFSSNIYSSSIQTTPTRARLVLSEDIPAYGTGSLDLSGGESTGANYYIGPKLEVEGDGLGANIYSIMTQKGPAGISKVAIIDAGNTYTTANVTTFMPSSGEGNPQLVNIRPVISPPGGHGSDTVSELNGWNVIISKRFIGSLPTNIKNSLEAPVSNTWPISNEYRTIGLLRNPILANGYSKTTITTPGTDGANWYANSTPLHQSTFISVNTTHAASVSGDYVPGTTPDEEVVGSASGARGRVLEFNDGRLMLTNIVANTSGGSFTSWEQIGLSIDPNNTYVTANGYVVNNANPAVQIDHDGLSSPLLEPDLVSSTGDILYIESRSPITRSLDQTEDVKIIIEF